MRSKTKYGICYLLTAVLSLGMLAGCGGSPAEDGTKSEKNSAKGRYLESEIDLPEGTVSVSDMVKLVDGTIRIAAEDQQGQKSVWNLQEDGSTWEKSYDFPGEWKEENGFYGRIALSPKGEAFASVTKYDGSDDDPGEEHYYLLDESGAVKEVPLDLGGEYAYFIQYTRDGELLMKPQNMPICAVHTDTGQVEQRFSGVDDIAFFGPAGGTVYMISYEGEILPYDEKTGEPLEKDEGLSESVIQSGASVDMRSMECLPLVFTEGKEEDEIFYCSDKGLYRHLKNGNVTEQLIDGSLTSIGNPAAGVVTVEAADDYEFYLLMAEDEYHLLHYVYSKDASTVPETQLKIWSLHENAELQQNISQYQKENPEAYVNLEVGVSEDNGITESDALKTLSTEIMAGKGPDLMVLDGMPVDSYIEKGMLEDVADVADGAEGLFENLLGSMEQEGKLYGIPLRFAIPLVAGSKEALENIHNLQSFADVVEALKGLDTEQSVYNPYYNGAYLAAQLYDTCSPAWLNGDKTLAKDQLEEFYTQLKRIYDTDNSPEDYAELYNGISESGMYSQYISTVGGETLMLYNDRIMLAFGNILSVSDLTMIYTTTVDKEEIQYKPLSGQKEHVYVPKSLMGINSQSREKDAAKEFLAFLLTEDAQKASMAMGLPVHQKAMESLADSQEESTIGSGMANDPDSYVEMHMKKPDSQMVEEFISYVKEADTPAAADEILRNAVLEQADDCVQGSVSPGEAVEKVSEKIRLSLAE